MTPEQLDEIEKLAEAFEEESTIILPLVKALREARARCEYMEGLVDVYKGAARDWRVAKDTAALQRDEARAEVERLKDENESLRIQLAWAEDE